MKRILVVVLMLVLGVVSLAKKPEGWVPPGQVDKDPEVSEPVVTEPSDGGGDEGSSPGESETPDPEPSDILLSGKKAYVIVPDDYKDLYVIAMDMNNNKYGYGLTEDEESEIGFLKDININSKAYYNNLRLLEISTEATKDIKLVVGYKVPNKDKYVLLSSDEIDEETLEDNYSDGDTLRVIKLKDYAGYSGFPGYEVSEDEVMTGVKIGEEEMKEADRDPSNIIKRFISGGGGGSRGAEILPSNSHTEFIMKSEDISDTVYVFKKGNGDPSNYVQINRGSNLYDIEVKEIKIRPQKKDQQLILNGELYTLNPHNQVYTFEGDLEATLINTNGSQWILYLTGTTTGISPSLSGAEVDEVYVIESEGLHYEGDIIITSENEGLRRRESEIGINVLDSEGIEVKSIEE